MKISKLNGNHILFLSVASMSLLNPLCCCCVVAVVVVVVYVVLVVVEVVVVVKCKCI